MGCISSKQARSHSRTPPPDSSLTVRDNGSRSSDSALQIKGAVGPLEKIKDESEKVKGEEESSSSSSRRNRQLGNSKPSKKGGNEKRFAISIRFGRFTEGEHIAAGWPAWLSAVAGEAVEGWLPLRSDNFERLEKIGEGTYSSVYRARDAETGKMVALKKVRFDNYRPESVRFMAREITILRRLDHPNIMKLEGIITSRLSYNIYFVFEYMEHDLSGLLSCPDIKFSDTQIKCYMRQLLCGIEHCHSQGVLHRDIKVSNILVNNKGILKIADFGLANFLIPRNRQPLTSRVVTLWYRPPELLLGSTHYGASVDLWSVGCVFAELFIGRPILKGRTEVEQLHKIFKLCGTPPDEYWKKSKLPLATMFKPQHPYESTLRERCRELPKTAVNLIETFLSVDPYKRGTASAALHSEYFTTKPCACDPSSLPKYPPNKEIDARFREEARRKKAGACVRPSGASRNPRKFRKSLQESSTFCKVVPTEEVEANIQVARRNNGGNAHLPRGKGLKPSHVTVSEVSQVTEASQGDNIRSVPVQITGSSGFAWAKSRKRDGASSRLYSQAQVTSRRPNLRALDPLQESEESTSREHTASRGQDEIARHAMHRQLSHSNRPDSFRSCDLFQSQELSVDYNDQPKKIGFSGPLLSQSLRLDGKEGLTRQAVCRSRFYEDM